MENTEKANLFTGVRECYKRGNPTIEEDKRFELLYLCNCYFCQNKYYPQTRRNAATVYVKTEAEIPEAKEFMKTWTCGRAGRNLPTVYLYKDVDF